MTTLSKRPITSRPRGTTPSHHPMATLAANRAEPSTTAWGASIARSTPAPQVRRSP